MKILNLYAGVGGNRLAWPDNYQVTAVEYDNTIAAAYADLHPNDNVIVGDAHSFLLENFTKYDVIWSSPPCPTHSQYRQNVGVIGKGFNPVYPDMTLYQEIILLQHNFSGKWVVENVRPYYTPLINAQKVGRHLFWSSSAIPDNYDTPPQEIRTRNDLSSWIEVTGIDLRPYPIKNKRQVYRNMVEPGLGRYVMDALIVDEINEEN